MKELDNFISKVGNDKVLHFLGGGFICSLVSFVAILQENGLSNLENISCVCIGVFASFILSVFKEMMDDKFEWKDIIAAIFGCIPVFLAVGIGILFNILSK